MAGHSSYIASLKVTDYVAALLGLEAPSLVVGAYLVGSHALGDITPGSDIDFLAVLGRLPEADELSMLDAIHTRLRIARPAPHLDGSYVLLSDLPRPAREVTPTLRYLLGERTEPLAGALTPVEWLTLKRQGVRLTGLPIEGLDINADSTALRRYCLANLVEYWTPQIDRLAELAAVESLVPWLANRVVEIALGVPRLLISIASGEVVSKTEAGQWARERFPEASVVLDASLQQRAGPTPSRFPVLVALAPEVVTFGRRCVEAARSTG